MTDMMRDKDETALAIIGLVCFSAWLLAVISVTSIAFIILHFAVKYW